MKCFENYRPGGMRVHAGAVILEPGLIEERLRRDARQGRLAGEGRLRRLRDAVRLRADDRVGEATPAWSRWCIPAARRSRARPGIWADHLLAMNPDVSFHVNGGPIAMPDAGFPRLVNESDIALQVCTAGNLRTDAAAPRLVRRGRRLRPSSHRHRHADRQRHHAARHALHHHPSRQPRRHRRSNGRSPPRPATTPASIGLNSGFLAPGKDADVVLIDACVGGSKDDALSTPSQRRHRRRSAR